MTTAKKTLPVIIVLTLSLVLSYYLFSNYKPASRGWVRGSSTEKEKKNYLSSLPLPSDSTEVGRSIRDGFSQITVTSLKSSTEIQQFFRNVLTDKGWVSKNSSDGLLSSVYTRDRERIEISVLSYEGGAETVFSISHHD